MRTEGFGAERVAHFLKSKQGDRRMAHELWMQPPDGGPPKKIEGYEGKEGDIIVPLSVAGWRQVDAPASTAKPTEVKDAR